MTLSPGLDPRMTAYRPDLAAADLRGSVVADRYAEGMPTRVLCPRLAVRETPDHRAPWTSELLMGEGFVVYDRQDGWAWGQVEADDYVGYVRDDGLGDAGLAPTHAVAALAALVFPEPDLKREPVATLSFGSRVTVVDHSGKYARLADGGWLACVALAAPDTVAPDYVATAARFFGVPYLWGGRSSAGLDCSGLVQVALAAAGIGAPRDSYQQERAVGDAVPADRWNELQRGDLVFFPGHVGFMADATTLLHANATAMAVSCDRLADVVRRIEIAEGRSDAITMVRRLSR
ncbi:MAG: C40 family peptidase [Rhodospirillaceae bacterium]|nr:C40 family peptidase [Rhodospirillaceae bacterium]